ncbi:winged helix DNA-binding domain-containing protein [Streptomyces spiramenti]|uniref:Winged helix DNA-binding domain-containing protein n=1 Tax=Streptomyces spiramenti TaxID=2720606 RepID=A0ABX1AL69_9ACTN|nr:winged helix DNA-binding domain-containing protein [Streptomyces spiramenti]NJP66133.1 winged helix DNA-binding domain-containing protein [Streptomyces spiramenti]
MTVNPAELNRATLARQLLLAREPLSVTDAVARLVAVQAQHPASPYLALWNRVAGFDPAALDAAFADGSVVKASLLRITLHAARADDYPFLRAAVQPVVRGARYDRRFRETGMEPAEAEALLPGLLAFASVPRTTAEFDGWLAEHAPTTARAALWRTLRSVAPLVHEPAPDAVWSFGPRPVYRAAPGPPPVDEAASSAALPQLVRRCLAGYGPASVADIGQFSLVARGRVREALTMLGEEVVELPGGHRPPLYDLRDAPRPPGDVPAPARLLGMWDNVLLAHADRSRLLPDEYRTAVTRVNGDLLPTLLVDGRVAGVWRAGAGGVEAYAFRALPRGAWQELSAEAEGLTGLLTGRDPEVYRRHHHWWEKLGDVVAERRLLSGPIAG